MGKDERNNKVSSANVANLKSVRDALDQCFSHSCRRKGSRVMLNRSEERGHPCLVPEGIDINFSRWEGIKGHYNLSGSQGSSPYRPRPPCRTPSLHLVKEKKNFVGCQPVVYIQSFESIIPGLWSCLLGTAGQLFCQYSENQVC